MMSNDRKLQEQLIFEAVKSASNESKAKKIVYGGEQPSSEDDASWVKSTISRLESHFDRPTIKQIRMNCQCGQNMDGNLALVQKLFESSSSLEEFTSHEEAKAAGLTSKHGELHLQFPFCPCPVLADVEKLDTDTWCQCTTGYSKVLFEKVFGCEVMVELLKSVKMGDDICLMKIIPTASIWK